MCHSQLYDVMQVTYENHMTPSRCTHYLWSYIEVVVLLLMCVCVCDQCVCV
jgi:hypothetical protein